MYNLIGGINKKNEDAFRTFFCDHFTSVAMFASRYVNDIEIAADLAQEGFVRLWLQKGTFSSMDGIKGFLYKTVRNLALDYIKHMQVENKYLQLNGHLNSQQLRVDMMEEEVYQMLYKAIGSLPAQSRKVMLYAAEGNSNQEIADRLGVSINTVRTLKQNSHRKMKEMLREYYYIFF